MNEFDKNIFKYFTNSDDLVIGSYSYKNPKLTIISRRTVLNKGRVKRGETPIPLEKKRGCGLKLFIDSLRKVNKTCCIIIVCNIQNRNSKIELYLKNNKANIIYNNFKELHHDDKFIIIKDILIKYDNYKNILISDIADVMFQNDPFVIKHNNKLYCACEQYKINDRNVPGNTNRKWIKDYYQKFKKSYPRKLFYEKHIICCGTIFGNYNSILDYLQWYSSINYGKFRIIGQGLFNVYCRENPEKCIIIDQKYGLIFTGGCIEFNKVKLSKQNNIINENKSIYTIIHQLNRWDQKYINILINSQSV